MATTYTPIATQTLGTATTTVTFSSIPSTYTDLIMIVTAKTDVAGSSYNFLRVRFNNDSTSTYSMTFMGGDGSVTGSGRYSTQNLLYAGLATQASSTDFGQSILQFQNYSNTTTYKTMLSRGNTAGSQVNATVGLWSSTSAINRIDIIYPSQNYAIGCTFTLYGIKSF